jgi:hypothetical protein
VANSYRVAAIFPKQLQSFADALKIVYLLIILLRSVAYVCRNVNRHIKAKINRMEAPTAMIVSELRRMYPLKKIMSSEDIKKALIST